MLWHVTGARVKGESPSRRPSDTAWESDPGVVRPTRTVQPSPALCGCCAAWPVSFRDTVPPTPVPPPRRAPRKRTAAPSGGVRPPIPRPPGATPWRKAGEARHLRHLPALCSHPQRCAAIPGVVEPCYDGTPPRRPLYGMGAPAIEAHERAWIILEGCTGGDLARTLTGAAVRATCAASPPLAAAPLGHPGRCATRPESVRSAPALCGHP